MSQGVTERDQISRLAINGFKSIEKIDLEMAPINIMIGANGAGKSNFISFLRMINSLVKGELQSYTGLSGGPDAVLHYGRKTTPVMEGKLYFGETGYFFQLKPTVDNRLMFSDEALWRDDSGEFHPGAGGFETKFTDHVSDWRLWEHYVPAIRSWRVYHFHDTSNSALVKQIHGINDNLALRDDAANLAAYLLFLKECHPDHYGRIVKVIRMVAPYFGDFVLRPTVHNDEKIQLEWTEQGKEAPFTASALSDGTLRFICLATVLLQPDDLKPAAIVIDEPELGLHPFAIAVLGGLMRSASVTNQIIVSTQSVELVNEFTPQDLIIVDKRGGASTFSRPDSKQLAEWLEDYSLGDLWKKNILGGRPGR
jgi:predicted ATPase